MATAAGRTALHTRALRRDELPLAADVLARAFWDDPVQAHLLPDPRSRYHRLQIVFRLVLATEWRKGVILTTDDLSGVAIWPAPGRWRSTPMDVVRGAVPGVRAFGLHLPRALRFLTTVEAAHPHEDHWYLAVLGTDPSRAGRGVGGALIDAVTRRCDRDGLPAYLESSKHENIAYYERFGFRVSGEITIDDGPPLHPMWRDPQPA